MNCSSATGEFLGLPLLLEVAGCRTLPAEYTQWQSFSGFRVCCLMGGETTWDFHRHPSRTLQGGQLLLIPRGMRHRIALHPDAPNRIFSLILDPSVRHAARNTPFTDEDLDYVAHQLLAAGTHVAQISPLLQDLAEQVLKALTGLDQGSMDPATLPWLRSLVCQSIIEATRCLFADKEERGGNEYIAAAREFMEKHLGDSITVNDIAAFLGYSPSRTYELFKTCTGLTPNDFLLRLRVGEAQKRLRETSASITEIAFDTGFSSSQYFARVFRKYTGMSPSDFRHRAGN